MKRFFLGLTLLLSTQVVSGFANNNEAITIEIEQANELNVIRSRKCNESILPRVGKTISSVTSFAMFADGTTASDKSTLTVLSHSKNLARIIIDSDYGPHEFLVGLVGDEYFGTSVDKEGTIVLKKVDGKYLDTTFTRIIDATGIPVQIRVRFRL